MSRNVVLVTIDSLRADHCGFMGYRRDTTPTLDRMAREGLAFENAIAPGPSTPESMPVVLTGSYPLDANESYPSLLAERRGIIKRHMATRETLAERFRNQGYATAGFSPNPYTSRYFGFDAGFGYYEDFIEGSRERLYDGTLGGLFEGTPLSALFPARVLLNWVGREEVFKPWEAFYDRLIAWTRRVDQPYFLWVLLMDTHDPYLAPSAYRTQSRWATYRANWQLWRQGHEPPFTTTVQRQLLRAYDDAIRYADVFLDRLNNDLDDDTLIAVHGDHGEAFGEHGTYGHHPYLYEENIHVPFVIGGAEANRIDDPISLRRVPDVLTTLAAGGEPTYFNDLARCRTSDGGRQAFRGKEHKFVHEPASSELYRLHPTEEVSRDNGELREIYNQLVNQWLESNDERQRIRTATEQLMDDV